MATISGSASGVCLYFLKVAFLVALVEILGSFLLAYLGVFLVEILGSFLRVYLGVFLSLGGAMKAWVNLGFF